MLGRDRDSLDVAIVANPRFDVIEPYAGGLEHHTDVLARQLSGIGHRVTVFAGSGRSPLPGSRPYSVERMTAEPFVVSDDARADVSMPAESFMIEHDAYLDLFERIDGRFDVIHNNSVHYLPVVSRTRTPTLHTLHTPPTPWLQSAHRIAGRRTDRFATRTVSVSSTNSARWVASGVMVDEVIDNGVDLDRWRPGDGEGDHVVWSGRLVPEKGPELAIEAARRCGRRLILAGPVHDPAYYNEVIRPRLGDGIEHVGHLAIDDLAALVGRASVSVVTPRWDEPFGLVAIESLACGTPVAAFDRGALGLLVDDRTGVLARPDDVEALAAAIERAAELDRSACRRRAVHRFGTATMASRYDASYRILLNEASAAPPAFAAV